MSAGLENGRDRVQSRSLTKRVAIILYWTRVYSRRSSTWFILALFVRYVLYLQCTEGRPTPSLLGRFKKVSICVCRQNRSHRAGHLVYLKNDGRAMLARLYIRRPLDIYTHGRKSPTKRAQKRRAHWLICSCTSLPCYGAKFPQRCRIKIVLVATMEEGWKTGSIYLILPFPSFFFCETY